MSKHNHVTITDNGPLGDADNFNKFDSETQGRLLTLVEKEQSLRHSNDLEIIKNDSLFINTENNRINVNGKNIMIARLFPYVFLFFTGIMVLIPLYLGYQELALGIFVASSVGFTFMFIKK